MAGHPRLPFSGDQRNQPEKYHYVRKVAWTIPEWAFAVGLSRSYVTSLISEGRVTSVKLGYKRLITTTPDEFLAALPGVRRDTIPEEVNDGGR